VSEVGPNQAVTVGPDQTDRAKRQLQDYLVIRRAMGFKMERHAKLLGQFVDYLAAHDAATLTIEHALGWAGAPTGADPRWWAARLSMVRGFAVFLHALDPAHQVPPRGLMPSSSRRTVVPYLYTDPQIAALAHAAGELSGPLRAVTYQTLIRLLAVTGMRVGEAIGLDRADLDPDAGLLTVHGTKFGKSRQLPLHPSTTAGLGDYLDLRDRLQPVASTSALLVSTRGSRLHYNRVWGIFDRLLGQAELSPGCTPRMLSRPGGAVPALLPVRFPRPLAEPAVPVSRQRTLHGLCCQARFAGGHGVGILFPR